VVYDVDEVSGGCFLRTETGERIVCEKFGRRTVGTKFSVEGIRRSDNEGVPWRVVNVIERCVSIFVILKSFFFSLIWDFVRSIELHLNISLGYTHAFHCVTHFYSSSGASGQGWYRSRFFA